jgi:hypothetical protein
MTRKLQITLYIIAAYLAVFGILFLFAPRVAEQITQTTHDPTLYPVSDATKLVFYRSDFYGAPHDARSSTSHDFTF